MKFEFLPHTADIRMRIEANSLPSLFVAGMKGMGQILKEGHCGKVNNEIHKSISVKSSDTTCLLIDFLSDVLTLCYTEKALFCEIDFQELSQKMLVAELSGVAVDEFEEEIKAVTYHEAEVKKNSDDLWESLVVFDI